MQLTFLNSHVLLERHTKMLEKLKAERAKENFSIGEVLSFLLPILSLYRNHIERFHKAGKLLKTLNEENKKFAKKMASLSHCPEHLQGLEALEIVRVAPIQRVPRYVLLLKELMKFTPENDHDFAQCQEVCNTFEKMLMEKNKN